MTDEQAGLDRAILNVGLDLAMEWGPDWLQPIQPRLAARYPGLGAEQLDAYDAWCRGVMHWAHAQVPEHWRAAAGNEAEARRRFDEAVLSRHSVVSPDNLSRLWSQGCYYAWKDGALG